MRTPRPIVIVRKPRTVAPRGPEEQGGTARSPVRPSRGEECGARSARVGRLLADHPRLRWLGRKTRLISGQRAPFQPASEPYPPRADPLATRTPIGLLPSPARGGRILHACRKDTTLAMGAAGEIVGILPMNAEGKHQIRGLQARESSPWATSRRSPRCPLSRKPVIGPDPAKPPPPADYGIGSSRGGSRGQEYRGQAYFLVATKLQLTFKVCQVMTGGGLFGEQTRKRPGEVGHAFGT